MNANKRLLFLLAGFCCLMMSFTGLKAQTPFLEKQVNVQTVNQSIEEVLRLISQQGGFSFSYGPQVVEGQKPLTVVARNKPVREILDQVFHGKVKYRERGTHIILVRVEKNTGEPPSTLFVVSGYITDGKSGGQVPEASIYDKESRASAVTNDYGYFKIKISSKEKNPAITLYVNKADYEDTVIYLRQSGYSILNLTIYPTEKLVSYVDSSAASDSSFTVNRVALVNMILNEEEQAHTRNIKDTLHRKFQASFLPYVGTNMRMSGNVVNDYSFNLLAGYSMGTRKLEFGGLMNVDRDSVSYVQIAGLANVTGGPVKGVQVAGLVNYNLRQVKATQIAGITNINYDTTQAFQIAGIANVELKPAKGFLLAGVMNVHISQANVAQLGGVGNVALEDFEGVQAAGVLNVGLKKVNGVQAAGVLNVNLKEVKGVQVSAVLNVANHVIGSQVGLINVADSCSGIPVGFLSYVHKGYHQLEVSADETYPLGVSFRTGVRQFYNIFTAGMQLKTFDENRWSLGYGLGTAATLGKGWLLDFDITMSQPMIANRLQYFNPLTKIYITAEKKVSRGVSIAFGPTLNVLYANTYDPDFNNYLKTLVPGNLASTQVSGDYQRSVWLGGKLALRFF